jgi:hypothetical protein
MAWLLAHLSNRRRHMGWDHTEDNEPQQQQQQEEASGDEEDEELEQQSDDNDVSDEEQPAAAAAVSPSSGRYGQVLEMDRLAVMSSLCIACCCAAYISCLQK